MKDITGRFRSNMEVVNKWVEDLKQIYYPDKLKQEVRKTNSPIAIQEFKRVFYKVPSRRYRTLQNLCSRWGHGSITHYYDKYRTNKRNIPNQVVEKHKCNDWERKRKYKTPQVEDYKTLWSGFQILPQDSVWRQTQGFCGQALLL